MYEVVVVGGAERTLRCALDDLVAPSCVESDGSQLTLRVVDQSHLVAVIGKLHDLGIPIEQVRHL